MKSLIVQQKDFPRWIGVIHLPPLGGAPGAPRGDASAALGQAGVRAVQEARALERAGFDAVILENFGDAPFYKDRVPPETVASMAVIAAAVRESVRLPIGINVLRNDARSALAIAAVTGSAWIRVNVLSGVAATDQGLIEGEAAELIRERDRLRASTRVLADVHVKHARSLSSGSLELAVEETAGRGGADGIIVTGATTGRGVASEDLAEAGRACREQGVPLYIGSGATPETLPELMEWAHGVIVGSALRRGGRPGAPLDAARIRAFMKAASQWERSRSRGRKAAARSRKDA